jgi:hypothetical protein
VGSPIINVLIKSDRIHRKVPHVGQTVKMEGRRGLYVVMRTDKIGRVADVMDRTGAHRLEENVPFAVLQTVSDGLSEAVSQFLDTTIAEERC